MNPALIPEPSKRLTLDQRKFLRPLATLRALAESGPEPISFKSWLTGSKQLNHLRFCNEHLAATPTHLEEFNLSASIIPGAAYEEDDYKGLCEYIAAHKTAPMIGLDKFTDEYQIYEARLDGFDSVLIPLEGIDMPQAQYLVEICREVKMDAGLWCQNEQDINNSLLIDAEIIVVDLPTIKKTSDFAKFISPFRKYLQNKELICRRFSDVGRNHSRLIKSGVRAIVRQDHLT
jgi:hypothetical protein